MVGRRALQSLQNVHVGFMNQSEIWAKNLGLPSLVLTFIHFSFHFPAAVVPQILFSDFSSQKDHEYLWEF